jgi:DNA adenine methylase
MGKMFGKLPFSYIGGKQTMAEKIISLIPKHKCYIEPFFGGGAVFFAKPPSDIEIINDKDDLMIDFYETVKTNFGELKKRIDASLHSETLFNKARKTIKDNTSSKLDRAWAVFIILSCSFNSSLISSTFRITNYENTAKRFQNRKDKLTEDFRKRLEHTTILNRDAIAVIEFFDGEDVFFYLDPPYYNSCNKYRFKYKEEDYIRLLEAISKIKGKFLLSSYPSDVLAEYIDKNRWWSESETMQSNLGLSSKKVEVLTMNYKTPNSSSLLLKCECNNKIGDEQNGYN